MKLSTKGRYGLRAMVDLAAYSENEPVSITSISDRQGISERYLEQLMAMLKKGGLIKSIRGAGGGYVLAKASADISVGDILRALEGSLEPVECSAFQSQDGCKSADSCVTKYVWQRINESINRTADEIKLKHLVDESKKLNCKDTVFRAECKN
ncbi:MAG: Rrf2 family transcriptional regulator [Schaedlerella sp.]|nr:Rrf2 family transcriptional regulator [Schaedlerella sp.]